MRTLLTYGLAMLVSLLPQRYRRLSSLHGSRELWRGAVLCGIGQCLVLGLVCLLRFMSQITDFMADSGEAVLAAQTGPTMDVMQVRLTTGVLGLANFVLQPLNMLFAYLTVEGMVRVLAVSTAGEILGTAPLYLVAALHTRIQNTWGRMKLGPLVADEIQSPRDATYDVHVLSCRPKPDWNRYITIRFRGDFYVFAGEEKAEGPRPFAYRLRKNPVGRLVIVIREYEVDEPLKQKD